MTMKVSRKDFLGLDELGMPAPEVVSAKMILDFEVAVFRRMEDLGIRQKDLAASLGVTAATVSKTLSETSNMTFKTAAKIANALGCVLDAPTMRVFDVESYGNRTVISETTVASVPTKTGEGDYAGTTRAEARRQSISQEASIARLEDRLDGVTAA
jgi:transcriptional regulator with XRE-family HTH domain